MINAYCNDMATLVTSGGYDDNGRPNAETESSVKTKYFDKRRLIMDTKGEQIVASGYFLLPEDTTITNEDKIKIDSVEYIVKSIEKAKHFSQSHYKVWVQ